jgi:hypothetical protein
MDDSVQVEMVNDASSSTGVISTGVIWTVLIQNDTPHSVSDFAAAVLYLKTLLYNTDIIIFHYFIIPFHALTAPFFMHPRPPTHSPK